MQAPPDSHKHRGLQDAIQQIAMGVTGANASSIGRSDYPLCEDDAGCVAYCRKSRNVPLFRRGWMEDICRKSPQTLAFINQGLLER